MSFLSFAPSYTQTRTAFQLTTLSVALALAGCGGGGGGDTVDSVAPAPDVGVSNPDTGTDSGNGGNTDTTTDEPLQFGLAQLLDAQGNIISSIGLDGGYYQVKVVDESGNPITNAKVSFDIDASGVELAQTTSGSVLTDADGVAQIFIKPESADVSGAYTIKASAEYEGNTSETSTTFAVQATDVVLSDVVLGATNLPSGGQTTLTLPIKDADGNALSGQLVNFSSSCGQLPAQATSDSNGMVEVVFKAINEDGTLCSGPVNITVSSGNKVQTSQIVVATPEATSIIYTANDLTLGIQNSGSSATGQVEFTVYADSTPLANQRVILSLEKSPLGLTFGPNKNQQDFTAVTDENGKVSVNIYPGSTPGPVEIKATLASDSNINALSKNITVASSRVTQTGLSLSWEKNVLDWSADGNTATIQARMVDRNGNAVPDGTVINFTAEGGKITPSCATSDGVCDVTFSTQNPRPGDGRVSILAVAEGEKDYIDMNENNAWDEDTDVLVHNIGDTFRDDNENDEYDIGEFTYPMLTSATDDCENNLTQYINLKFPTLSDLKKAIYERNYIGEFVMPNKPNTCNTGLDAVVRYQGITLLADSNAKFTIVDFNQSTNEFVARGNQVIYGTQDVVAFRINSAGFYDLNPMPSGTTFTGAASDETNSNPTTKWVATNNGVAVQVNGANPNENITVKVGELEVPVSTDAAGNGITQSFNSVIEGDISVEQETKNCTAVFAAGEESVSANVATGKPGDNLGTISVFELKDCQAEDKFTITATTPNGDTTKARYTLQ